MLSGDIKFERITQSSGERVNSLTRRRYSWNPLSGISFSRVAGKNVVGALGPIGNLDVPFRNVKLRMAHSLVCVK